MKQLLALKCSNNQDKQEEINQKMDEVYAKATGKCYCLLLLNWVLQLVIKSFEALKIFKISSQFRLASSSHSG